MNARDVQLLDDVVEDVCNEDIIDDIDFRRVSIRCYIERVWLISPLCV